MRKFLCTFLSLCMVLTMMPSMALNVKAEENVANESTVEAPMQESVSDVTEEASVQTSDSSKEVEEDVTATQKETVSQTEEKEVEDASMTEDTQSEEVSLEKQDETSTQVSDEAQIKEDVQAGDEKKTEEVTEEVEIEAETEAEEDEVEAEQAGEVARNQNTGRLYYTIQDAVNEATKGQTIVILMNTEQNVTIGKELTLDLNGHTMSAARNTPSFARDFGPIYLTNNAADGTVTIKNGVVKAEIDGLTQFDAIHFTGPVVLENIKVEALTDRGGRNVPAQIWTDGHPYTIKSGTYGDVHNINSVVKIEGGRFNSIDIRGESTDPNANFDISGGDFVKPVDKYVANGYVQEDSTLAGYNYHVDRLGTPGHGTPDLTKKSGSTAYTITIFAEPEVQYSMSPKGPWYAVENGKLVKYENSNLTNPIIIPSGKENGVSITGSDKITFERDRYNNPLVKGNEYEIYSRYVQNAIPGKKDAHGNDRNSDIIGTKLSTSQVDAGEIARVFNEPNESGLDASKKTTTNGQNNKDEKATNPKVTVGFGDDGNYLIKLDKGENVAGTVQIKDNWSDVTLDLNGKKILGPDGTADSPEGKPAIVIGHKEGGNGTGLNVIDSSASKGGEIKGGDAYKGSGANGGDGIKVEPSAKDITIGVGTGASIKGGNGADSSTGNGGNGGTGINGTPGNKETGNPDVTVNGGKVSGGNGGNATGSSGNGGNGGDAIKGFVQDVKGNGAITGGNGGSSTNGTGGNGGSGVTGDVLNAETGSKISGGNGGNSTNGNGGAGGSGATGNVGNNKGTISGGDGGASTGSAGGNGGTGTGGNVNGNSGTIIGGDGGSSSTGNGGNGGSGATGNITNNTGNILGGDGGDSSKGNAGKPGSGSKGNVSGNKGTIADGSDGIGKNTTTVTSAQKEKNELSLNAKLKVMQKGKKITIEWGKVKGATGYDVYVAYCGTNYSKKPNQTLKGENKTKITITKVNGKPLKLAKNFKVYVQAFKMVKNKKINLGKTIPGHIVGVKNTKCSNVKAIKLKKNKFTLSVGKTAKIKGTTVLVDKKKKPLSDEHAKELRFASANKKIAKVDKTGVITAKKKGTCTIYVYARNGYAKKVKVTVK